jgi:putative transposase
VKYQAIEHCRDQYPIRMMCRCLHVSASGFYDWLNRLPSERHKANKLLLKNIKHIHEDSDGVMGAPRIWEELNHQGLYCGLNRVASLMRNHGIQGIPQRRKWHRKHASFRPDGISNHLNRDFKAVGSNHKWVTDITYIETQEGWLYLCVVIDLYSGVVVGWSMSHRQTTQLVVQAVLMALWQRSDKKSVILHSDRGCQFTSKEYQRFLKGHNLISSMSAVGSCADNAACEGFFGILKRERVNRRKYANRSEARSDVFDYIERFYNPRKRRKLDEKLDQQKSFSKSSVEPG